MPAALPLKRHFAQPRAVRNSLLLSLLALLLLQAWRPLYFLTDDNLCGWLPVVADMGRSLAHGESPLVNSHLYGGGHELMRDPASLCLWNPLLIPLSLLSQTAAVVALPDLYASLNLLLCAFATAHLLCRLRELKAQSEPGQDAADGAGESSEGLSDGRIVLLTLSYTFSAYALITGASWVTFIANQASLPVIALGLLHPRRRTGALLVMAGVLQGMLGGHMSPLIFSLLFLSVFVAVHSILGRSREMAARWLAGSVAAIALASPLLMVAARGFAGTPRSGALNPEFTAYLSIPLPMFVTSFLGGRLSVLLQDDSPNTIPDNLAHIVCCLGAMAIFHSLGARRRQSALEWAFGSVALLTILFIVRPPWLTFALSHVPILRSLRIPMREVFVFLFFVHGWIALRPVALAPMLRRATLVTGAALLLSSLLTIGPPSFSEMERDRELLTSGRAARFWDSLRPQLRNRRYVPAIEVPIPLLNANLKRVPWSLLGAYNYAALFGVDSRSGYYIPGLQTEPPGAEPLNAVMGIYDLPSARRLQALRPGTVILSLASIDPPRIDWIEGGQRRALKLPPMSDVGPLKQPAQVLVRHANP